MIINKKKNSMQILSLNHLILSQFFSRFDNDNYTNVPLFIFGDFNFRLDTHLLVQVSVAELFFNRIITVCDRFLGENYVFSVLITITVIL